MKTWTRAVVDTLCGGPCESTIPIGRPMLLIQIDSVKARFVRCEQCAGTPAPPDLPAHIETVKLKPLATMARLGLLPLDEPYEREPGEEG